MSSVGDPKGRVGARTFLSRLLADKAGATMMMMAAAMIPIIGMAGSAFDMGRLYMVKTRLQQACDAGALAGRRAMDTGSFTAAAKAQADSFFKFNFIDGAFGSSDRTFTPKESDDGQVTATASAVVPMTIMRVFNGTSVKLDVACDAKLEVTNTDIMFVLDVTGSMNCPVGTEGSCNGTETGTSKIGALRAAVADFYDTIDSAISDDARLRFGFVPYSSTVNVGDVLPSEYLRSSADYQSRAAKFSATPTYTANGSPVVTNEQYASAITAANCSKYGANTAFTGFAPNPAGTPINDDSNAAQRVITSYAVKTWNGSTTISGSGSKTCIRTKTVTKQDVRYPFTGWTYQKESYDTSAWKTKATVKIATTIAGSNAYITTKGPGPFTPQELGAMTDTSGITTASFGWNGCVEERKTWDLDIDFVPNSEDTRWTPMWPDVWFTRSGTSASNPSGTSDGKQDSDPSSNYYHPVASSSFNDRSYIACPKAATKLAEMTKAEIQNYVSAANGFKAIGGTYHDFGMIWGARLISATGLFKSENTEAPNKKPINRHIIFMTDGDMSPADLVYGMYGTEKLDQRISGGSGDLKALHNTRFSNICAAIKAQKITIWVVAYAQGLTTELTNCADPGKAMVATSDKSLKDNFKDIAAKIAELRLSK